MVVTALTTTVITRQREKKGRFILAAVPVFLDHPIVGEVDPHVPHGPHVPDGFVAVDDGHGVSGCQLGRRGNS